MIPANAPAFRLFFNTGKRAVETGAAWPNRAGTGFNVQLDSLFGSRALFMVPNLDRDGQPAGAAPFKILYPTGRIRADGGQHSRVCGVAHVSRDGQGYDLYVADPVACLRLTLRPPDRPGPSCQRLARRRAGRQRRRHPLRRRNRRGRRGKCGSLRWREPSRAPAGAQRLMPCPTEHAPAPLDRKTARRP